jgi:hypothetical protein
MIKLAVHDGTLHLYSEDFNGDDLGDFFGTEEFVELLTNDTCASVTYDKGVFDKQMLAGILYDYIECGWMKDVREVELPDGRTFHIEFNLEFSA